MSQESIRAAMEQAVKAVDPAMPTAWQNVAFDPPGPAQPYQRVYLLFAQPENPTTDRRHYRERGFMQVSLYYPKGRGSKAVTQRAELLRSTFAHGATFASGGVNVIIDGTPEVSTGQPDGDRWAVPVKIRFYSDINTA